MLSRVYGGAVEKGGMKPYLNLDERNKSFSTQKRNLALIATKFISDCDLSPDLAKLYNQININIYFK